MPLYLEHELMNQTLGTGESTEKKRKYEENRLRFPYEITYLDSDLNLQLLKDFTGIALLTLMDITNYVEPNPS